MTAQIKKKKLTCPECSGEFANDFDRFSIQATKRCVDCQKKYEAAHPELDPTLKQFRFYFSYVVSESEDVFAKDEEEAREKFAEQIDYDDPIIDEVTEIKRKP